MIGALRRIDEIAVIAIDVALAFVAAAVERQAIVEAVNEAWALVAILSLAGALTVLLVRPAGGSRR